MFSGASRFVSAVPGAPPRWSTPPTVFGRSLRPALEGRPFPSRPVVSSLILYTYPSLGNMEVNVYDAVRTPEMKLFRRTVLQIGRPPQLTHVAYRDILRDPLGQGWIIDSPETRST